MKSSFDKHWKDGPLTRYIKPATQLAKLRKEKQPEYALVLVKMTSQVDGRTCVVFDMSLSISIPIIFLIFFLRMQSLYCLGHIQVIHLTLSSTSTEIENTAKAAFSGLSAVLDGIFSMDGSPGSHKGKGASLICALTRREVT
jgi:hypothetical protein